MRNEKRYFQYEIDDYTSSESNEKQFTKWYCKISNWFRIFIVLALFTIIILAILFYDTSLDLFTSFISWMKENIYIGSGAFVLVCIVCTVIMVPGSFLTLGAGFVYVDIFGALIGVPIATVITWTAASIGILFMGFSTHFDETIHFTKKNQKNYCLYISVDSIENI